MMTDAEIVTTRYALLEELTLAVGRKVQEVGPTSPLAPGLEEAQKILMNWKLLK